MVTAEVKKLMDQQKSIIVKSLTLTIMTRVRGFLVELVA